MVRMIASRSSTGGPASGAGSVPADARLCSGFTLHLPPWVPAGRQRLHIVCGSPQPAPLRYMNDSCVKRIGSPMGD